MRTFTLMALILLGVGCASHTPYDFAQWQGKCDGYTDPTAQQECIREVNASIQEDLRAHRVSTYESSFFDSEAYYQTLKDQQQYWNEHDDLQRPQPDRLQKSICRTSDQLLGGPTTECLTNY